MEWPRVELGRVVRIRNGTIDPSRFPDETFELFSIPGFDEARSEVTSGDAIKSNKTAVVPGDVLFSKLNPRIQRVWVVPQTRGSRQISSTEFWPLVCDSKVIDRQYLRHFLLSPGVRDRLSPSTEAATKSRSRIKPYQLLSERIPLPPLSEQRRIVEILDQADRLRRLRTEADAKADRILPALFIKMFGDPATNPMGWPVVPLGQLGRPLSGGAFPISEQGLTDGEVPFIKVSDMNTEGNEWFIRRANNYVSLAALRRLKVTPAPGGTTVFPKIGAAVATNKKRLLVQETAYDNNVIGVIPRDSKYSAYLFGFFQLFDLRTLARSTALPSIKTSELARLPVPKPRPQLAESFAARFLALSETRDAAVRGRRRIDDFFQVLMHQAFSGPLTASWREARMKELLQEMEQQAQILREVHK